MLSPFRASLIEARDGTLANQVTTLLQAISDHDIDQFHQFIDIMNHKEVIVLNGYEAAAKFSELWMAREMSTVVEAGLLSGLL
jgi:hypothetical protein